MIVAPYEIILYLRETRSLLCFIACPQQGHSGCWLLTLCLCLCLGLSERLLLGQHLHLLQTISMPCLRKFSKVAIGSASTVCEAVVLALCVAEEQTHHLWMCLNEVAVGEDTSIVKWNDTLWRRGAAFGGGAFGSLVAIDFPFQSLFFATGLPSARASARASAAGSSAMWTMKLAKVGWAMKPAMPQITRASSVDG